MTAADLQPGMTIGGKVIESISQSYELSGRLITVTFSDGTRKQYMHRDTVLAGWE